MLSSIMQSIIHLFNTFLMCSFMVKVLCHKLKWAFPFFFFFFFQFICQFYCLDLMIQFQVLDLDTEAYDPVS